MGVNNRHGKSRPGLSRPTRLGLAALSLLALCAATLPAAHVLAGVSDPLNPFSSFTDSGPMAAKEREKLRAQRSALQDQLAPGYELTIPLVSPAAVEALRQGLYRYQQIAARGGWPSIDPDRTLRPGDTGFNIAALRQHLWMEGDLTRDSRSATFDNELVQGLARFQVRNGLPVSGFVDRRTAAALNITAAERVAQISTNLNRLQDLMTINKAKRYVLVNVAGYQLQAVENGQLALASDVIVGRPSRATPLISANIVEVNFYPMWRVPDSVARKDLIPAIRKDQSYFYKEHFSVMPDWGRPPMDPRSVDWMSPQVVNYKFRQDPGPFNALGVVRINMPNSHAVYMHDTPMKDLFGQSIRAFSSGCVRVKRVVDLVAWLVQPVRGWDAAKVYQAAQAGESVNVKIRPSVPVHFVYLTAFAQQNGIVQFRPDIYGRDQVFAQDDGEGGAVIAQQRNAITP